VAFSTSDLDTRSSASLRQSGLVLRILDMKGCTIPCYSSLSSKNLDGDRPPCQQWALTPESPPSATQTHLRYSRIEAVGA
jgi:hypothetical protein